MVTCTCNMWRYGHKLPNTQARGIDEYCLDFHLRAQFLQPTVCYQPASCLKVNCLPCSSHLYCQVQSRVMRLDGQAANIPAGQVCVRHV